MLLDLSCNIDTSLNFQYAGCHADSICFNFCNPQVSIPWAKCFSYSERGKERKRINICTHTRTHTHSHAYLVFCFSGHLWPLQGLLFQVREQSVFYSCLSIYSTSLAVFSNGTRNMRADPVKPGNTFFGNQRADMGLVGVITDESAPCSHGETLA